MQTKRHGKDSIIGWHLEVNAIMKEDDDVSSDKEKNFIEGLTEILKKIYRPKTG